jgi:hypothetical protein
MSEVEPKKMVSRSVAIALGIICIILAVSLVGAFAYYMPTINDKDNTISSLKSQFTNLQHIADLNKYLVIANNYTIIEELHGSWYLQFNTQYSGYVSVTIYNSTNNPTNVEVDYTYLEEYHNSPVELSTNGTAIFPVVASPTIPCSASVFINFYPPIAFNFATVTIIYYY